MDEQMEDMLALYALGGLTADEQQAVETYLDSHPEAEARLREMVLATASLAYAAPPVPPSAQMEEALMARVTADAQARFVAQNQPAIQPAKPQKQQPTWAERTRARWQDIFSSPVLVTAVAVATITFIFAWAVLQDRQTTLTQQLAAQAAEIDQLQTEMAAQEQTNEALRTAVADMELEAATLRQQLSTATEERQSAENQLAVLEEEKETLTAQLNQLLSQNEQLSGQLAASEAIEAALRSDLDAANEVLALFASPQTEIVSLPGTPAQSQAQGQLLFAPDSHVSVLLVNGMEELAPGQVYQVLLIRDDGHDTAETFAVDVQGQTALIVHSLTPMESFTAVGVSIEPEGGSPQRTGDIILLGDLLSS